jgi:hypothetical protein
MTMNLVKKNIWLSFFLMCIHSVVFTNFAFATPKDPVITAENCRQLALKLDWLSRYQDRPACTKSLDGLQAYIASRYIAERRYNDAEMILRTVVYQINFAIDTNCYGQEDSCLFQ